MCGCIPLFSAGCVHGNTGIIQLREFFMFQNRSFNLHGSRAKWSAPKSAVKGKGRRSGQSSLEKNFDMTQFVKKAIATDAEVFHPEHRFSDFPIHEKLKKIIADRGFENPTPIQDNAIPHILDGRDVIGIASTGTGKTGAFLIPLINKVFHAPKREFVLVLVPTRELALQIREEFVAFSKGSGLRSALVIGGAHMHSQVRDLRLRPNFVFGTPGRIKDLIERRFLDISAFNNVVLDEVDRMLDMGFVKDIKHILSLVQKERQSLFFSATLETGVRDIAKSILVNPITIFVKSRATSENVHQDVVSVSNREEKIETLHELLLKEELRKVLVFSKTKHGAEKLAKALFERGFKAGAIHGDLSQGQRERSLVKFREDHIRVLVATDVAARGLDIDGITHVINYDLPMTYEDYIHRIGRTGRGTNIGYALTFVDRSEVEIRTQSDSRPFSRAFAGSSRGRRRR